MNQTGDGLIYISPLYSSGGGISDEEVKALAGEKVQELIDSGELTALTIADKSINASTKIINGSITQELLDPNINLGGGASIDDTQASDKTTYSSNKIEADFQKINDNILTTNNKTIVGSINELNEKIGNETVKSIPESYIKVYRNILEQPNGKIANGNKCQSTIGQGMMYLPKTNYVLYHIKNNDVIENSLQDGHTYTLTYNSDSNATVEYFIFDYAVDSMDIKCIAKETVTSGTKITMPTNSYWFQMNTLKSDNITNISLVDDAFPYDNIRLVVADGNVSDTNTQIAVSTIGDIASVGEYIKLIPEKIGIDSTGIYKYIDDKVGSGTGSGELTDYQKKTDNTLDTTDKTVIGAINEINGDLLDTVGFSTDYKNIIFNRKNGLNPYTIPISAIINNVSLAELKDVDSTDVGNGKILVYDGATNKHKYVDSSITDEFVKMNSATDAKYLSDLIDKSTIVNDNGVLKVKKLDGQEVTITEINYLKGLTMNVMDLVNAFANGGVKVWETPANTYSDLETLDRSTFVDGISYIVYVLIDETHSNAKTTYLCTKTSTTFFGNADSQRNFTTNPIDLANEVTGKLGTSNIDVDSLWTLLTINDTYKTLTTNNEIFGTHGAKTMYDELTTKIGAKANATDLTTHTGDTDIHVTTTDKAKWDKVIDKVDTTDFNTLKTKVDEKVDKTSIITAKDNSATDDQVYSAKAINTELDGVVKKTDISTTIDSTSTDDTVPTNKAVFTSIKNNVPQLIKKTYSTNTEGSVRLGKAGTIINVYPNFNDGKIYKIDQWIYKNYVYVVVMNSDGTKIVGQVPLLVFIIGEFN